MTDADELLHKCMETYFGESYDSHAAFCHPAARLHEEVKKSMKETIAVVVEAFADKIKSAKFRSDINPLDPDYMEKLADAICRELAPKEK